jgi:hypothetical protein
MVALETVPQAPHFRRNICPDFGANLVAVIFVCLLPIMNTILFWKSWDPRRCFRSRPDFLSSEQLLKQLLPLSSQERPPNYSANCWSVGYEPDATIRHRVV